MNAVASEFGMRFKATSPEFEHEKDKLLYVYFVSMKCRHVTASLDDSWWENEVILRDLHRLWPVLDSSVVRGKFRWRSKPSSFFYFPKRLGLKHALDDAGREKTMETASEGPSGGILGGDENAALPLPIIPGIPQKWMEDACKSGMLSKSRCKHCRNCLKSHRNAICLGLKAARHWWNNLGGVSPALAKEMALKLRERLSKRLTTGTGTGLRCGHCYTCTVRKAKHAKCMTVEGILTGTLPARLKQAAQDILPSINPQRSSLWQDAAGKYDLDADNEAAKYFQNKKLRNVNNVPIILNKKQTEGIESSMNENDHHTDTDEEDEDEESTIRWENWMPFLLEAKKRNSSKLEEVAAEDSWDLGGDKVKGMTTGKRNRSLDFLQCSDNAKRPAISHTIDNIQSETSQATWVCTNFPYAESNEPCGHANVNGFRCESCGLPRWSGPNGQLHARIAAILYKEDFGWIQSNTCNIKWPLEDVAAAIASRISLESGTTGSRMYGFDPMLQMSSEFPGTADDRDTTWKDLTQQVEEALPSIIDSLKTWKKCKPTTDEMKQLSCLRKLLQSDGKDSTETQSLGSAALQKRQMREARNSMLGKAATYLENVVREFIEEQEAFCKISTRKLNEIDASTEIIEEVARDNNDHAPSSLFCEGSQDDAAIDADMDQVLNVIRSNRPSEDPYESVNYQVFCQCIRELFNNGGPVPDGLLELLYCSRQENTWNVTTISALLRTLRTPSIIDELLKASKINGTAGFRRVFHYEMRSQLDRIRAHEVSRDTENLLPSPYLPATQQSQFLSSQEHRARNPYNMSQEEDERKKLGGKDDMENLHDDPLVRFEEELSKIANSGKANRTPQPFRSIKIDADGPQSVDSVSKEDERLNFLERLSLSTLHFTWDLVEMVMNKAIVSLAEEFVPKEGRPDEAVFTR